MLGSLSEADDAVQEAWLRLSRADTERRREPGRLADHGRRAGSAWTCCARASRGARSRWTRTCPTGRRAARKAVDPEQEALLADSVGLALLVVLETLAPAERLAFVLHDMFAVPFDEIAPIVGRSPAAARQLASRARRRVQGAAPAPDADLTRQREVVDAFLAASRGGDFDALLAVLDPDVVLRADRAAVRAGRTERRSAARRPWPRRRSRGRRPGRPAGARQRRRGRRRGRRGGRPRVVLGFTISGREDRRDRRDRRPRAPAPARPGNAHGLTSRDEVVSRKRAKAVS